MANNSDNRSLLLFRVGPVLCCAPSLPVLTIIHPPELTRPPGSDAAQPGIFKHAGKIVSSFDLRYKFGVDKEQWVEPGRLIVTNINSGSVGFWVDEIQEVMETPGKGWNVLPPLLPRGIFTQTLLLDKNIYLYSEFDNLYKIPTSGYLRVYIEHLLEQKKINQSKQDINKAKSSTGSAPIQGEKIIHTWNNSTQTESTFKTSTPVTNQESQQTGNVLNTSSVKPVTEIKSSIFESESLSSGNKTPNTIRTETKTEIIKPVGLNQNTVNSENKFSPKRPNNVDKTSEFASKDAPVYRKTKTDADTSLYSGKTTPKNNHTDLEKKAHRQTPTEKSLPEKSISKTLNNTLNIKETHRPNTSPSNLQTHSFKPKLITTGNEAKPSTNQNSVTRNHPSGGLGFIIVIFLSLISIPGVIWYLNDSEDKDIRPGKSVINEIDSNQINVTSDRDKPAYSQDKQTAESSLIHPSEISSDIDENIHADNTPENHSDMMATKVATETDLDKAKTTGQTNEAQYIQPDGKEKRENTSAETTSGMNSEQVDYHADIQADNSGITIILEAPEQNPVFKHELQSTIETKANTTPTQNSKNEMEIAIDTSHKETDVTTTVKSKQSDSKAQLIEQAKTTRTEIVHIVVKGDTLWHIAIRYVNNPYKYPELARLSNIKNPDLIYPGNRVRIIKKNHPAH